MLADGGATAGSTLGVALATGGSMMVGNRSWPPWATEAVGVVPYDHSWPAVARQLRDELTAVAEWLVADIEHVGSTAVPGLAAKPIIDLMAGVDSLDVAPLVADRLAPLHWHLVPPELDGRPWRRLFVKVAAGRRAAHLHLMQPTSERWRQQLVFRDRLRGDPDRAAEYAQLKRGLAAGHARDREGYGAAKAAFIDTVLRDVGHGLR